MPEDAGGKHVKVKKRQHQNIMRFRDGGRKLILGSIGTLLDHLKEYMPITFSSPSVQPEVVDFSNSL